MNFLDRFLQRWRISKAKPFLARGARVLDIGCADGALSRQVSGLAEYIGIDPYIEGSTREGNTVLVKGRFPKDLPDSRPFDAIALLAVVEHIPPDELPGLARDCAALLKPGGHLVITVPSPMVDRLLRVLRSLHVLHGMSMEEHHGFRVGTIAEVFSVETLRLVRSGKFQLGLNNLFVFRKAAGAGEGGE